MAGNFRWWIAGLLSLATALNYLDRQSFPVVVGEIRNEIPTGPSTGLCRVNQRTMQTAGPHICESRWSAAALIPAWNDDLPPGIGLRRCCAAFRSIVARGRHARGQFCNREHAKAAQQRRSPKRWRLA